LQDLDFEGENQAIWILREIMDFGIRVHDFQFGRKIRKIDLDLYFVKFGCGHPPIGYGFSNKKKNRFGYKTQTQFFF
jgi:hypothetical protein